MTWGAIGAQQQHSSRQMQWQRCSRFITAKQDVLGYHYSAAQASAETAAEAIVILTAPSAVMLGRALGSSDLLILLRRATSSTTSTRWWAATCPLKAIPPPPSTA